MSNINPPFTNKTSVTVPLTEQAKLSDGAMALITVLLVFIGTILVTIGIGVAVGWAWAITVLGALVIVYGLITGNSI